MFGANVSSANGGYAAHTSSVRTWKQLHKTLDGIDARRGPRLEMFEIVMDREDAPVTLLDRLQAQKDLVVAQANPAPKVSGR